MSVVWRLKTSNADNANINLITSTPSIYVGSENYNNISSAYAIGWNRNINLSIEAKDGYKFDNNNPPLLILCTTIGNQVANTTGIPLILTNNDTVATIDGYVSDLAANHFTNSQFTSNNRILDLYAYTLQSIIPPNITFTNNIQNTVYTSVVNSDNSVTVTITANNSYYFTDIPTITYINTNNQEIITNFTLNADNTQGTINIMPISGDSNAVLNGNTALIPTHNIINNVNNTTLTTNINGNTVELTLTSIGIRYYFTTVPTVEYYENGIFKTAEFVINANNVHLAEITINADKTDIIINGVCQYAIPIEKQLSNVVLSGVNEYFIPTNQNVLNLTLTAMDGFYLDIDPYIELWGLNVSGDKKYFTLDTDEPTITANLNYNIDNDYNINNIYNIVIHCFAVPITAYDFGAINVYKVTKQNLNDFSSVRYGVHSENLNDYVVSLKQLYANVGITTPNTLKCGNIDTNINVGEIINDKITIDCNSILIPFKNNDNVDYDTELNLFLPFYGMYNLNNSVIGRWLNITYIVSTLTGQGFIYLKDITDNNEYIVDKLNVDISSSLFYEKITDNANINQFTPNYLNGLTPILYIKYYENKNNYIYNSDCIRAVLNTFNGFISVTELTNFANNSITETEYKEMINLLNNGVFIEN